MLPCRRPFRTSAVAAILLALGTLLPAAPATAQPFGSWAIFERTDPSNYFQIPDSSALTPAAQITIEGWVNVSDPGGCSNIIGKGWQSSWWVGICGTQLRSYLRGSSSIRTSGNIGQPGWHHFAVTFDGAQRCHYIDGEQAACWAETGNLPNTSDPVRIGSDVDFPSFAPNGAINEIRLWNVARTVGQIRATINEPITSPMPGLVAVWANGGPEDVVGPHDGIEVGIVPRLTFPVAIGCSNTPTSLCLRDRFVVSIQWRNDNVTPPETGPGRLAGLTAFQSGVFYFFNPSNWEVMVKLLNGCPINNRYWMFSAATTNVFYRMDVLDQEAGVNKVYFNYPGPPAPAVTDTTAFDTCP